MNSDMREDGLNRQCGQKGEDSLVEQLHAARAQLLQSEKMAAVGQLAAGVAHEINNPIGYIGSNLGMLHGYLTGFERMLDVLKAARAAAADGAPWQVPAAALADVDFDELRRDIRDLVEESIEGVTRVRQIVQDLKDFSRAGDEEWAWADVHRGLDSTLNVVGNELKYKAEVIRQYGDLPQIECLASQLNQVFLNLLVNAAHAIANHGTITIRTGHEADDAWVWIEIADSGCGIMPEHLSRIFEPFFTTKPAGKGTGLGLALARDIVHKHGGSLTAASDPGCGTTFRIRLPVRRSSEEEAHHD